MVFHGDDSYVMASVLPVATVLGKVFLAAKKGKEFMEISKQRCGAVKKWNRTCSPLEAAKQTENFFALHRLFAIVSAQRLTRHHKKPQGKRGHSRCPPFLERGARKRKNDCTH